MARALLIAVSVALIVGTVLADYKYTLKQAEYINNEIVACIKGVPNKADGTNPGDDCRFEANIALAQGSLKENLPGLVKECMAGKGASNADVKKVNSCLITAMAKDVPK